ncbi:Druantia anti-phage system protein DruA [Hydrocarboniphaga sp.]|uniref:Druantia anti-phage system protein DruA n=1 Tax=Hydrocarboniphaga sp. TaxID=2033016 RepID=UPI00260942FD|nr:Druantia anti-phage system protein DruA [Hydrocarboniphaga sp.]
MLDDWRLFSPKLDDDGSGYSTLAAAITADPKQSAQSLQHIAQRLNPDNLKSLRTRASALLLRDLVSMGWELKNEAGAIFVRPATRTDGPAKQAIRKQLEFGRDDQLAEPATRRFILNLERPGRFSSCRSVTDLIADGRRLAVQLEPISALPREQRDAALSGVCQPYLQLVDGDARDEHTGIRLIDIWRYFRHNWSTRYRSSPGRNLFYLIRDAAQPFHPVMGITALGNAVMQLGRRDVVLGWTVEGLKRNIEAGIVSESEALDAFRRRLLDDLGQIYVADMPIAAGLPASIDNRLLDQLSIIESDATGMRTDRLKQGEEDGVSESRISGVEDVDLEAMAKTPLFRAKRARAIREVLRAYRELKDATSIADLLTQSEGEWAVNQSLRQLKKAFSATAMMEITVCGGVPPYSGLLSGKLACLMMMSRRVADDYATRYDTGYSIIASQMAGRPIVKPPALVFLGTSSLYTQRSSQYNRVSLPAGTVTGQNTAIHFDDYGVSEGYGSPNLSSETEETLDRLTEVTRTYRNVNFVFGEGQSPKLRQLREGFAALGLSRTNLLHHGMPRIVYGVHLARNTVRYLLGVDSQPDYCIPRTKEGDADIAAYWRSRWLASRVDHVPALVAAGQSTPLKERVSRLIHDVQTASHVFPFSVGTAAKERDMAQTPVENEKTAFIRQLYRDESAYSDHVSIARLKELNVKTALDDVVRKIVRAGGSVVITGNAGDGKTHTIRLLKSDLEAAKAEVIIDASAVTQDHVIERWNAARSENRPFCIAINEGPLIELIRTYSTKHPWLENLRQQLLKLVSYVSTESEDNEKFAPEPGATVVIDLSLRRTLAPDLIKRTLDKLTDDTWYTACTQCPANVICPVTYNRTMLKHPRVQQRLVDLLQHVAERGLRATFRELLAFGSYLIFAGKSCSELLKTDQNEQAHYYWNAFEGQGAIFESLEQGLDPVRQTQARIDEDLWRGKYDAAAFQGNVLLPLAARDFDEARESERQFSADTFAALKRRWYFEHPDGRLGQLTQTDKLFRELQDSQQSPQLRVGRLVALINEWWNRADRGQQDRLRLWTRLSYSPRANGKAMVSGRDVSNLRLGLFRPKIAPALRAAFGEQAIDHLLLAPPNNVRFASLVVDRKLLSALLHTGGSEQAEAIGRRLATFNDALAQYAEIGSHVRTIELLDPANELSVKVRVDLSQRRYDSAQ